MVREEAFRSLFTWLQHDAGAAAFAAAHYAPLEQLVLAALTPLAVDRDEPAAPASSPVQGTPAASTEPPRDDDLAFYDTVIERIARGEAYYDFIVEEQRAHDYPVRPGFAVRLPTLAYVHAWLGEGGMIALAIALMAATVWAWWRRLGEEPGGLRMRRVGAPVSRRRSSCSTC